MINGQNIILKKLFLPPPAACRPRRSSLAFDLQNEIISVEANYAIDKK
jgi:hypothetical protein